MRRVMHGDVVAAARALLALPESGRRRACQRMIHEAHCAHRYMRRFGRAHALWGDGSLMATAHKRVLLPEPGFSDTRYCGCVEMVLHELIEWRAARQITRGRRKCT
ncbi:hypothetical protein [uncultured Shimia sp.]|uniref:DUF7742 family protein n=1 Tax=uncultured Shimia sp. TaxID=573152 RepID=UPI00262E8023|nr:hypothetical protein [uncultured Shimia sp.]